MDAATSRAALATGDVDGVIGMSDLFSLRDQGVARVIYLSKGDASVTCNEVLKEEGLQGFWPAQPSSPQ